MKLQEGQVWKLDQQYVRIVHLERLVVDFKTVQNLKTKWGTHHHATKKEFCRLLKNAVLLSPAEIQSLSRAAALD
jgi:hypothetical protein